MRTLGSRFTLVLALVTIVFAAGCRDEVTETLDEIEVVQQEILALLEQRIEPAAATAAAADTAEKNARTALENTGLVWEDDSIGGAWRNEIGIPCHSTFTAPGTPFCDEWREARRESRRANSRHEDAQRAVNNRTRRYAQRLAALRRAHEDDIWGVLVPLNPNASGRSIVITYLRELEDELENERARLQSTTDAPTR